MQRSKLCQLKNISTFTTPRCYTKREENYYLKTTEIVFNLLDGALKQLELTTT
jgi:hypothetical protein